MRKGYESYVATYDAKARFAYLRPKLTEREWLDATKRLINYGEKTSARRIVQDQAYYNFKQIRLFTRAYNIGKDNADRLKISQFYKVLGRIVYLDKIKTNLTDAETNELRMLQTTYFANLRYAERNKSSELRRLIFRGGNS